MGIVVMMMNYFHDLAVAFLAASLLAVWIIGRWTDRLEVTPEFIPHLFRRLSRFTWYTFWFVILGGGFRAWAFMEYEWNPAVGKGQVAALIVKHLVLGGVTLFGLIVYRRYARKYGR